MAIALPPKGMIAVACVAHVLSMLCFSAFPTLLPEFVELWSMSATEAGSVSSAFFVGYTLSVPVLTILSDRIDARQVYLFSSLLTATGCASFAMFAAGPGTASLCHALIGAGVGGTYMPGLKALGDHIDGRLFVRATAIYTGMFGVGGALSYLIADRVYMAAGWPPVFLLAAITATIAGLLLFVSLPPKAPETEHIPLANIKSVLTNKTAVTWSICYGLHSGELFALRAWAVAFLVFVASQQPSAGGNLAEWLTPVRVVAFATLLGLPLTIFGNEMCIKYGRRATVICVMVVAGALAVATGLSASGLYIWAAVCIFLYNCAIMGDSSALTAGALTNAAPGLRGATMALHSTLGFAGGAAGPFVIGFTLDHAGGSSSPMAWTMAFGQMALIALICPILIRVMRPRGAPGDVDTPERRT